MRPAESALASAISWPEARVLPPYVMNLVTAAAGPRNSMASHGQDGTVREVREELADASIVAAATAITLLAALPAMTGVEWQPALAGDLAGDVRLGAAAERFARNTLRKSAQTRRTYLPMLSARRLRDDREFSVHSRSSRAAERGVLAITCHCVTFAQITLTVNIWSKALVFLTRTLHAPSQGALVLACWRLLEGWTPPPRTCFPFGQST
jgi:hypothetical protein